MRIQQLFEQGVRKIRLPAWNQFAYLQLQDLNGKLMPWCKLYDIGCNGRALLIATVDNDDYEAYTEPQGVTREYLRAVYEKSECFGEANG